VFQSDNPEHVANGLQYMSMPEFGWPVLRQRFPGIYEKSIGSRPSPDEWISLVVKFGGGRVQAIVNNARAPQLDVALLTTQTAGRVADAAHVYHFVCGRVDCRWRRSCQCVEPRRNWFLGGETRRGCGMVILTNADAGFGVYQRIVRAATACDQLSFIANFGPLQAADTIAVAAIVRRSSSLRVPMMHAFQ
jgi:hypothetical protein